MITVILVEYHKLLHVFLVFFFFFNDEHSSEYWKMCYHHHDIMKANSHIVKSPNFFGAYSTFLLIFFFLWL